jgi:uncharacterized membrane protein
MGPFAAGTMLFWGAAAAVPIVLHLLRRRKTRTVQWGAMQFLERAIAQRAKRFQFWRLLLLALRVSLIVLIACALARPMIGSTALSTSTELSLPRVLRIFMLDVSFSMQAIEGDMSRFQRAQQIAVSICQQASGGDGFLLATMGQPSQMVVPEVSYRADEVADQIQGMQPGEGIASASEALYFIQSSLEPLRSSPSFDRIDVVMLSDLQQTTWELPADSLPDSGEASSLPIRWFVVDCGSESRGSNLAVTDLRLDVNSPSSDAAMRNCISPVTHLFGAESVQGVLAQLVVDGQIEQTQRFDIEPGATRSLLWSLRLSPGYHAVEVRLGQADMLLADNVQRKVFDVQRRHSVALFAPQPVDSRYVELAVAPGGGGGFSVHALPMTAIAKTELGQYDVWVLCNPSPVTPDMEERLRDHVEQGGGLVWWLGPNWRPGAASDNRWTAESIAPSSVVTIDPMEYASPLVAPFAPFPGSGLLTLPVFQYWQIRLGTGWQVALGIRDGDSDNSVIPLIATLESDLGGRQVIVATPPGPGVSTDNQASNSLPPWNALIAWPAFVPLVQEMLAWVSNHDGITPSFVVGQAMRGSVAAEVFKNRLQTDQQHRLSATVIDKRMQKITWTSDRADHVGFYRWVSEASLLSDQASSFADSALASAVNVDVSEGVLRKVSLVAAPLMTLRPNALGQLPADSWSTSNANEVESAASSPPVDASDSREISWWFLLAAIGMLASESVVVRILERKF